MTRTTEQRRGYYRDRYHNSPGAKERQREASRRWYLKKKYGLTPEEVEAMLSDQGGCAICGRSDKPSGRGWHVDHCHSTGKVRGVLCHWCNLALGHFHDDPARMRRAADYIEKAA